MLSYRRQQLFRKRLSEKVHATIPKGIVGDFEITVLHRNFERMAREAMDCVSDGVLRRSSKSRLDSYNVRNSVWVISHITFLEYCVYFFPTTFLEIAVYRKGKCAQELMYFIGA